MSRVVEYEDEGGVYFVKVDDEGFVCVPVFVELERDGPFDEGKPVELKVHMTGFQGRHDLNVAVCANLNLKREQDSRVVYLGEAHLKVNRESLKKITEADLKDGRQRDLFLSFQE